VPTHPIFLKNTFLNITFRNMSNHDVGIRFLDEQTRYAAGETVSGIADIILPKETTLSAISLTFVGRAEVEWMENQGSHYFTNNLIYSNKNDFLKQTIPFTKDDVTVIDEEDICSDLAMKRLAIAFSFQIPSEQNLPSSMVSSYGFIKYQIQLTIETPNEKKKARDYVREILIEAPLERHLMITVNGTTEKEVLLHSGHVSMHASLGRKGFTPDETVNVYINVDNQTNIHVTPRVSLHQVQTYTSDTHQKTVEADLSKEPVVGAEIAAHTKVEGFISIKLPDNELLSIKTDLIKVKYFLRVTLDIPQSPDLHINLPVVLISKKVFEIIQTGLEKSAEFISQ